MKSEKGKSKRNASSISNFAEKLVYLYGDPHIYSEPTLRLEIAKRIVDIAVETPKVFRSKRLIAFARKRLRSEHFTGVWFSAPWQYVINAGKGLL